MKLPKAPFAISLAAAICLPALAIAPLSRAHSAGLQTQISSRDYMTTGFTKLTVRGPIRILLHTGKPGKIEAKGSPAAIDRLRVDRNGQAISLSLDGTLATGSRNTDNNGPLTVHMSTHSLENLSVIGAGDVSIDQLTGSRMQVNLSGAANLNIGHMAVRTLILGARGASSIRINKGQSEDVSLSLDGAPSIAAANFTAQRLDLRVAGPASVEMNASKEAKITNNGSGNLVIGGKASCVVNGGGLAYIICGGRNW